MIYRTIGDDISEAMNALEHATDTEAYDRLSAGDRAYLQEALHHLQQI